MPLDVPTLLTIVQNVAVVLVLSLLHDLLLGHLQLTGRVYKVGTGVLFGIIAIVIMMVAAQPLPGIRVDGRNAIVMAASAVGGLPSGALAAVMVVLARPARMPAASVSAPIAAARPVAVTKRRHASTLGPIDPAGNVIAASASASMAAMGSAPGSP